MMIDLLVLLLIVVVLTAFVYVLVIVSTKEKSFEDAVKEQKQKFEQEQAQQKADKQQKKNKLKKPTKIRKDEAEGGYSGPDLSKLMCPDSEMRGHIHDTIDSQIITTEPEAQIQLKKRPKKPKPERIEEIEPKKIRVEEINSEEQIVNTSAPAPQPTFDKPPKPDKREQKREKKVVDMPVEKEIVQETVQVKTEALPPVIEKAVVPAVAERKIKKEKEVKKDKGKSSTSEVTSHKLLQLVENAHLTGTEIQGLVDSLLQLERGSKGGEWVEKGRIDPTAQLRRQLEEVEARMKEQQDSNSALSTKITVLRGELNAEKTRVATSRRQLETIAATHQKQLEHALNAASAAAREHQNTALNELRATLESEFQVKMQQQKQVLSNEEQIQVQNQQLKASLSESELQVTVAKQECEELNQRCQKYEQHISSLQEKHTAQENSKLNQIADLQKQLNNKDIVLKETCAKVTQTSSERDKIALQLSQCNSDSSVATMAHTHTQNLLQDALIKLTELEKKFAIVDSELSTSKNIISEQTLQIECLKEEKESLASQSVRPAAEGQENGDVHVEQNEHSNNHEYSNQLETLVKEKEKCIELQSSEVTKLKLEISRLREDLEGQKTKNDNQDKCVEEENRRTREFLTRLCPDIKIDNKLDQVTFLKQFEVQAAQVKTKEVIVEKIVEKVVEDKELKKLVEDLKKENGTLKSRVESLQKQPTTPSNTNSEALTRLEEENRSLVDKVAHYQKVLGDTEALLKSLQASVEGEESAWKDKLSETDTLVKQLNADKANLQNKVQQLENTLEKVKQAEEGDGNKLGVLEEENVKLRALVNVGQDSNRQQEQLISQLQQELSESKNSSTNGPSSTEQCADGGARH